MKPNVLMTRDIAYNYDDDSDDDDLPALLDVSDFSDESESESESEPDNDTPQENKGGRHRNRIVKRGADGRPIWPPCEDHWWFPQPQVRPAWIFHAPPRGASPWDGDQRSTAVTFWPLRHRNFSPVTLPRRNQFLADQFFERGSRRARAQVARDLERRRVWYQGKVHGNK